MGTALGLLLAHGLQAAWDKRRELQRRQYRQLTTATEEWSVGFNLDSDEEDLDEEELHDMIQQDPPPKPSLSSQT